MSAIGKQHDHSGFPESLKNIGQMKNYIDEVLGYHQNPKESRNRWNALNTVGSEHMGTGREDLLLLKYLIMANRPKNVVESGTYRGYGSICILEALFDDLSRKHNFLTIEHKKSLRDISVKNVKKFIKWQNENGNLNVESLDMSIKNDVIDMHFSHGSSGDSEVYKKFFGKEKIDFAFIDCGDRFGAFNAMYPFFSENAIVCLHDAWDRREQYKGDISDLLFEGKIAEYTNIPTERGMCIIRVSPYYRMIIGSD